MIKQINSKNGQKILSVFCYKTFVILIFFLFSWFYSQTVSGLVINEKKTPIPGAIVTLFTPNEDETIDYSVTDENGYFKMQNVQKGNYKMTINNIGFNKIETKLIVTGDTKTNYTLTQEKEQKIDEVILTSSKPIKIKSDTIEINAKSFLNGTEKNVEDLLKKLPNVTVENDGKIKIQGKEIEKVMVENDDFFEKGYSILTKNMSVKPIEKVQILQNYSNNKLLKGVENSEKVAINLTLANDVKREWFGNMELSNSVFPESFYSGKINLTKFGKIVKYFLLGSTNTIGINSIGDIQYLIKPSVQDEAGFINIADDAYKFGTENFVYLPFGSERAKFNNDKLVSANTIFNLSKKIKLKIISLGNFEKSNFNKSSITDYNLDSNQFSNIEDFYKKNSKINYFNKIDLEYDISNKMNLKYSGNINYWTNNNNEYNIFNGLPWYSNQQTVNHSTDSNIILTNKIKEKLIWLSGIRFLDQKVSNINTSDKFFFNDLFTSYGNIQSFYQNANSNIQFVGAITQFLYKTQNENLWNLSIYNNFTNQNFTNQIGFEKESSIIFFPLNYANNFNNKNNDLGLSIKYTSILGKFKINPQLEIHYLNNRFENNKNENFFYLIPKLNVTWQLHNKGKLNAFVFYSKNNTTVIDMLPNYFSDTPRSLVRGINSFDFLKNSGTSLNYNYGNWSDRFFITLFGSYTRFHNYLSYNYKINQENVISNLTFLNNRDDYTFSSELNYYLRFLRSNFKINYSISTSKYKDQIEQGELRNVFSTYNSVGFQLKSAWKKVLNYHIGTEFNTSKIIIDEHQNKIINQQAFLDLLFTINNNTKFEIKNKYYSLDDYFSKESSYLFTNLKLIYQYDKNTSFSLIGNNLLNIKKFRDVTITSYSTHVSEYSLFPRYFMLEINIGL